MKFRFSINESDAQDSYDSYLAMKSMSLEDVLKTAKVRTTDKISNKMPMFITPDGGIIDKGTPVSLFRRDVTHDEIMCDLINAVARKNNLYEVEPDEIYELLNNFTSHYHLIRVNPGNQSVERRFYMVLPGKESGWKVTNSQWYTIEDFIEYGLTNKKDSVLVYFGCQPRVYLMDQGEDASDIVTNIKRFYTNSELSIGESKKITEEAEFRNMKYLYIAGMNDWKELMIPLSQGHHYTVDLQSAIDIMTQLPEHKECVYRDTMAKTLSPAFFDMDVPDWNGSVIAEILLAKLDGKNHFADGYPLDISKIHVDVNGNDRNELKSIFDGDPWSTENFDRAMKFLKRKGYNCIRYTYWESTNDSTAIILPNDESYIAERIKVYPEDTQ